MKHHSSQSSEISHRRRLSRRARKLRHHANAFGTDDDKRCRLMRESERVDRQLERGLSK